MLSANLSILDVPAQRVLNPRCAGKKDTEAGLPWEKYSSCPAKPLSNGEKAQEVVSGVISWISQRRNLKGGEFLVESRYPFRPFVDRRIGGRQHRTYLSSLVIFNFSTSRLIPLFESAK